MAVESLVVHCSHIVSRREKKWEETYAVCCGTAAETMKIREGKARRTAHS
jgi:hypothetical protein